MSVNSQAVFSQQIRQSANSPICNYSSYRCSSFFIPLSDLFTLFLFISSERVKIKRLPGCFYVLLIIQYGIKGRQLCSVQNFLINRHFFLYSSFFYLFLFSLFLTAAVKMILQPIHLMALPGQMKFSYRICHLLQAPEQLHLEQLLSGQTKMRLHIQ